MKLMGLVSFVLCFVIIRAEISSVTTTGDDDFQPTTQETLISFHESRIVGGYNAIEGQFPYQISLQVNGQFNCGGSIIAQNYVLTAAHCVSSGTPARPISASALTVRAGSILLNFGGQLVRVLSVRVHPSHRNNNNDIAVLKLSRSLQFNSGVKPIALAGQAPPSGARVITSGWGRTRTGGSLAQILQYNVLTALSHAQCRQRLPLVPASILCLSHTPGNGVCSGDSGGPAVYQNQLVGVTNFVVGGCASNNPDGYARVPTHLNWIKQQLNY